MIKTTRERLMKMLILMRRMFIGIDAFFDASRLRRRERLSETLLSPSRFSRRIFHVVILLAALTDDDDDVGCRCCCCCPLLSPPASCRPGCCPSSPGCCCLFGLCCCFRCCGCWSPRAVVAVLGYISHDTSRRSVVRRRIYLPGEMIAAAGN